MTKVKYSRKSKKKQFVGGAVNKNEEALSLDPQNNEDDPLPPLPAPEENIIPVPELESAEYIQELENIVYENTYENYNINFAVIMGPSASGKTYSVQNDLMTRLNESEDGRGCEDLYALDGGDFREVSASYNASIPIHGVDTFKKVFKQPISFKKHLTEPLIHFIMNTIKTKAELNTKENKFKLDSKFLDHMNNLSNFNLKEIISNQYIHEIISFLLKPNKTTKGDVEEAYNLLNNEVSLTLGNPKTISDDVIYSIGPIKIYLKYKRLFERILLLSENLDMNETIKDAIKKFENPKCKNKLYIKEDLSICSDLLCDKITEENASGCKQIEAETVKNDLESLTNKFNNQLLSTATKLPSKITEKMLEQKKDFTIAFVDTFVAPKRLTGKLKSIDGLSQLINTYINGIISEGKKMNTLIIYFVLCPKLISTIQGKSRELCEGKKYSNKQWRKAITRGFEKIQDHYKKANETANKTDKRFENYKFYINLNMGAPQKDGGDYEYTFKQNKPCEGSCDKACSQNMNTTYMQEDVTIKVDRTMFDELQDSINTFNETPAEITNLEKIKKQFNALNRKILADNKGVTEDNITDDDITKDDDITEDDTITELDLDDLVGTVSAIPAFGKKQTLLNSPIRNQGTPQNSSRRRTPAGASKDVTQSSIQRTVIGGGRSKKRTRISRKLHSKKLHNRKCNRKINSRKRKRIIKSKRH